MSKLDEMAIDMVAKNMSYIKLGLAKNEATDEERANWLYYLLDSYKKDIDAQQRADAIARRTRLNCGYTKGAH